VSATNRQPRQRPLSPHLQVYKPQLTSVLSIMHRITGVALAVFSLTWVIWLLALAAGPAALTGFHLIVTHPIGTAVGVAVSWSLFYHLFNGIRHLIWDTGNWLSLRSAYASGWSVVALSLLATVLAWGLAL